MPKDNYGAARWAKSDDLDRAGMFAVGHTHLGATGKGQSFYYEGEEHILTLAPPGTGKTAGVVIPSILINNGSMVITDPKGALTAQTARFRKHIGQRVVILNPWRNELTKELGQDLGSDYFNPLYQLTSDNPNIIDDCETLATLICPSPPNAGDPHWTKTGRDIIAGLLILMALHPAYDCTLPELYRLVRGSNEGWARIIERMGEVSQIDMEPYADDIIAPMDSPKQWAGYVSAMKDATSIYNPNKTLSDHVARNEFDPRDLKRENITVYIVVPSNRREANKQWLALVVGLMAEAVGSPGKSKRVTFLIEEFQNLGYLPMIANAMAEYREAGLHCHLIVQTLHRLKMIYGTDGAENIINLCGVRQFFGVDDLSVAETIEKSAGTFTAETLSHGRQISAKVSPFDKNMNYGEMAVPLVRASDLLNMPRGVQIIFIRGEMPPIKALIKSYYHEQWMIEATDPNPYRNEPKQRKALNLIEPPKNKAPEKSGSQIIKEVLPIWGILAALVVLLIIVT